ncbi:hypothetical protein CHARACLAT_025224, partial [Characodon lateralis]|nr:hypothetical protein [Characodon lateralis]
VKEERLDEINAPRSHHNAESCVWCLCFRMDHTSPSSKTQRRVQGVSSTSHGRTEGQTGLHIHHLNSCPLAIKLLSFHCNLIMCFYQLGFLLASRLFPTLY